MSQVWREASETPSLLLSSLRHNILSLFLFLWDHFEIKQVSSFRHYRVYVDTYSKRKSVMCYPNNCRNWFSKYRGAASGDEMQYSIGQREYSEGSEFLFMFVINPVC